MKIYSNHLSKSDPRLAKQELKLFLQTIYSWTMMVLLLFYFILFYFEIISLPSQLL